MKNRHILRYKFKGYHGGHCEGCRYGGKSFLAFYPWKAIQVRCYCSHRGLVPKSIQRPIRFKGMLLYIDGITPVTRKVKLKCMLNVCKEQRS